jgi:hypothetical protein
VPAGGKDELIPAAAAAASRLEPLLDVLDLF